MRLPQEDMCQVTGRPSHLEYQADGVACRLPGWSTDAATSIDKQAFPILCLYFFKQIRHVGWEIQHGPSNDLVPLQGHSEIGLTQTMRSRHRS